MSGFCALPVHLARIPDISRCICSNRGRDVANFWDNVGRGCVDLNGHTTKELKWGTPQSCDTISLRPLTGGWPWFSWRMAACCRRRPCSSSPSDDRQPGCPATGGTKWLKGQYNRVDSLLRNNTAEGDSLLKGQYSRGGQLVKGTVQQRGTAY